MPRLTHTKKKNTCKKLLNVVTNKQYDISSWHSLKKTLNTVREFAVRRLEGSSCTIYNNESISMCDNVTAIVAASELTSLNKLFLAMKLSKRDTELIERTLLRNKRRANVQNDHKACCDCLLSQQRTVTLGQPAPAFFLVEHLQLATDQLCL